MLLKKKATNKCDVVLDVRMQLHTVKNNSLASLEKQ